MKPIVRLSLLLGLFLVAGTRPALAEDAGIDRLKSAATSGEWTWHNNKKDKTSGTLHFMPDGSVVKSWIKERIWHWSASGPFTVEIVQEGKDGKDGKTWKMQFNDALTQFTSTAFGGITATQLTTSAAATPPPAPAQPAAPAPTVAPVKAPGRGPALPANAVGTENQLEVVASRGPSITATVITPLGVDVADIRPLVTMLRDNILDEQAQNPVAVPGAYQAAVQLCDGWLSSMNEREQYVSSYKQTRPPTRDMESGKIEHLRPRDYLMYQRELDDALKYKKENKQLGNYFDDAKKKLWSDRCLQINNYLTGVYNRFRTLRREPMTPK